MSRARSGGRMPENTVVFEPAPPSVRGEQAGRAKFSRHDDRLPKQDSEAAPRQSKLKMLSAGATLVQAQPRRQKRNPAVMATGLQGSDQPVPGPAAQAP